MSPEDSRDLKKGDRVGFLDLSSNPSGSPLDHGTVIANNIHAVQIQWDDIEGSGCANGIGWISHNDSACLVKES